MTNSFRWSASQTLITGVYRTGSEYLAQLVGRHPQIAVEMYSVNVLRFIHGKFDPIELPANQMAALDALDARLQARYGIHLPRAEIESILSGEVHVGYGTIYDAVMSALYLRNGARHWAEKNQLLWREIPTFLEMMPNGRAILILRDPRSVLVSFKNYTYAPPPAYLGSIFNCLDAMLHAQKYARELPADKFRVVRYEDVASRPQQAATELWRFIGLEPPYPDVMAGGPWHDAHGETWRVNSSFHSASDAQSFDVQESLTRWRSRIKSDEADLAEIVCGSTMRQFGYDPESKTPDWQAALRLFMSDDQVLGYFKHWLSTGEGIEAFPTDPLRPENWRSE